VESQQPQPVKVEKVKPAQSIMQDKQVKKSSSDGSSKVSDLKTKVNSAHQALKQKRSD
jgi:hypothetical protein